MNCPIFSLSLKNSIQDRARSVLHYKSSFSSYAEHNLTVRVALPNKTHRVWQFLKKIFQKKPTFYLAVFCGLLLATSVDTTSAATTTPAKTFIATAYYTPLPGQSKYFRANYEADLALNGGNANAADGTETYAGMIAAPKNYPFGTKILLDGLGVVSVHDRGGAIVEASNGGHAYDRIDIWMGYGEEALERAMAWGKREILGTIVDSATAVNLDLDTILDRAPTTLDIALKKLALLGYTAQSGETPEQVILRFQLEHGVIANLSDTGAGNYGPKTTAALAEAYEQYMIKNPSAAISLSNITETKRDDSLLALHDAYTSNQSDAIERAKNMNTTTPGTESPLVLELKKFLAERDYYAGSIDTSMDIALLKGLRAYQHDHGLRQTGRVDIPTRLAIREDLTK